MIALVVGLLIVGGLAILYQRVDARSRIDEAQQADAIIVLGAQVSRSGRPGTSLSARIDHAIKLYKQGYAPYLIFSGGLGTFPPTEAESMRRVAADAGVPASAMILEDESHSTEQNLAYSKKLMDARGLHSAIIVSDPFHLYRAEIIARDLGIQPYGSGAINSPNSVRPLDRVYYTAREAIALVWYYGTRIVGEPTWVYGILKGKI
ncbi:MAG: YdcF family protein [Chloroflexi bacterium]|nr:YdcF family protein [Chloroflexota bacterium]